MSKFGRRELLLGLPLLAAAGSAVALTPRKTLNLLGNRRFEDAIPLHIDSWTVTPSNAVILPKASKGSLADRLYNQTVSRLYLSDTEVPVMLVIAYGDTQSDQLQLHRPEACYTAVGFQISHSEAVEVPVGVPTLLPARELIATNDERVEPILYWTRIGDYLPSSGADQRWLKLKTAMQGYVADGTLVRMSTAGVEPAVAFAGLQKFARAMLHAAVPAVLPALVGRAMADSFGRQA